MGTELSRNLYNRQATVIIVIRTKWWWFRFRCGGGGTEADAQAAFKDLKTMHSSPSVDRLMIVICDCRRREGKVVGACQKKMWLTGCMWFVKIVQEEWFEDFKWEWDRLKYDAHCNL